MTLQGDIRNYIDAAERPVTLDELVDALGHTILPGRATRAAERRRRAPTRNAPSDRYKNRGDTDHAVAVGRRICIHEAAENLRARGRIERTAPATYHTKETPR